MAYSIPITLLILSTSLEMGKGCFSSGVCGNAGSYGCPQPIAPVCSGGCSSGYSCGQYGCYARARARSPKILDDMVIDSPINDDVALRPNTKHREIDGEEMTNERFYQCCIDRQLPDSCLTKCSYETYTKSSLQAMYLRIDKCPLTALSDISYCAAGGMDHTECCIRNGVTTTFAGKKCLTFCDQRPGNITKLDLSYLPCYERFDSIKRCFIRDIIGESRPLIRVGLGRTFES